MFDLSTLLALAALERVPQQLVWASKSAAVAARRTGDLFAGPLLDHYAATLSEIHTEGFLGYWKRQFRPYLRAAAAQFAPDRSTLTDRVLARRGARGR